jgi:hypothetical protein
MTLTLPELIERLKELDEVTLLELLGVTSESLVDRFSDVIEDKQDTLTFIVDWD